MSKLCSDQESQVSVADMFKRIDKNDQGDQNSKNYPNPDFLSFQNAQSVIQNFDDICTGEESDLHIVDFDGEEDDDNESSVFSMPLNHTLVSGLGDNNRYKQELFPLKGRKKESHLSSEIGILKFACTGYKAADSIQVTTKHATGIKEEAQGKISRQDMLNCKESIFSSQENGLPRKLSFKMKGLNHHLNKSASETLSEADSPFMAGNQLMDSSHCLETLNTSTSETGMVSCPICRQQKLNWPLDQLNTHIDLCLSKQTVKDILLKDKLKNSDSVSHKEKSIKRYLLPL